MDHFRAGLIRAAVFAWTGLVAVQANAWQAGDPPAGTCFESGNWPNGTGTSTAWYALHELACNATATRLSGGPRTYVVTACESHLSSGQTHTHVHMTYTPDSNPGATPVAENDFIWRRTAPDQPQCLIESDPPTEDEDCGGNDISVGEAVDDSQTGRDIWGPQPIRAATWNDAAAAVPECIDTIGGAKCTVTGIYKTGPGLDKDTDGTYSWLAQIRFGGGACTPGDTPAGGGESPTPEDNTAGENCRTSDAGVEYCHENEPNRDQTDCGFYEDEQVCLDRVEDDECWVTDAGTRYCSDDAPMPPAPDSGVPGDPAVPDDTIRDPDTDDEFDRYTPEQSDESARPVGDSGANPNRPGSTDPSSPTQPVSNPGGGGTGGDGFDPQGDDSAGGGGTCDEAPTCDGDPIQCAILSQQWKTRCVDFAEVDLVEEMGFTEEELGEGEGEGDEVEVTELDADGIWSSASCPAPTNISVMGHSIEIDVWQYGCMAAEFFAPFVLAMGYLLAGLLIAKGIT